MAITASCLSLFAIKTGAWASFVTTTTSKGQVSTGTISLKTVACLEADNDSRFVKGDTYNICGGGAWQPCTAPSATSSSISSSGAGFTSTSSVIIDDLSASASHLPSAIPVLVTNHGNLSVARLELSVIASPVTKSNSSLLATVLYGGRVVASAQPLSALAATPTQLLSSGHLLRPGATGLVQIDLTSAPHAKGSGAPKDDFAITVTLTGSDA
jgi:hypothetical protein